MIVNTLALRGLRDPWRVPDDLLKTATIVVDDGGVHTRDRIVPCKKLIAMEIVRLVVQDGVDLTINGRLDSYWAEHLDRSLAEAVREGHDRLRLDLSRVTFLSSAGIAVLMKVLEAVARDRWRAGRVQPLAASAHGARHDPSDQFTSSKRRTGRRRVRRDGRRACTLEREGARLEVFDLVPGAVLRGGSVAAKESGASLALPGFAVCHRRRCDRRQPHRVPRAIRRVSRAGGSGCVLAWGRHARPGLSGRRPGRKRPKLQVLRGLTGEGEFARLLRFDPTEAGAVGLAELATWCLELSGGNAAGLAIVAEAAGLVGAALRHSPAIMTGDSELFAFPAVRNHLSFTAERAFVRTTAVVTGFVARDPRPELRPLGGSGTVYGHFHAAAFSFAPLRKGLLALKPLVAQVFEHQSLLGVLHLLNDDRPAGAGQSELVRGACWFGPVQWGS